MAADWIKMRIDLQSHPKVVRILSALDADKFRVIGGLHAVWTVFDIHTTDGVLRGYTPKALDHIIGWAGFADAMIAVGWLSFDGKETIGMPEFSEHNGKSAKRRSEDQKRKRDERRDEENVREPSASDADKLRTKSGLEKEKSREDTKKPSVSYTEEDRRLAEFISQKILQVAPKSGIPNFDKWSNTIRLMREQDNLTHREIAEVFDWANRDSFWRLNILSIDKLRKQFAQLSAKREATHAPSKPNARQSITDRANAALDAVLGPDPGAGPVLEGSFDRVDEHAPAH